MKREIVEKEEEGIGPMQRKLRGPRDQLRESYSKGSRNKHLSPHREEDVGVGFSIVAMVHLLTPLAHLFIFYLSLDIPW
jgi:hypothetical protein